MECFLRDLKVSLALKVKQENRDRKEKQVPLDLRALLEKQGLRYVSGLKISLASIPEQLRRC